MARCVFFSFHYQRDIWRVNQVRNSWLTQGARSAGFIDVAEFEAIRTRGRRSVEKWIDEQLHGTTITAILIGKETVDRDYVHYEIQRSIERGNGLVPIYIQQLRDREGRSYMFSGENPLEEYDDPDSSGVFWRRTLADVYPSYDWIDDDGYRNFGLWVERAYSIARP